MITVSKWQVEMNLIQSKQVNIQNLRCFTTLNLEIINLQIIQASTGPMGMHSQQQFGYPYKTAQGSAFTYFVNFL